MHINTTASDLDIIELNRNGTIVLPDLAFLDNEEEKRKIIQPSSQDLLVGNRAWLMAGSTRPTEDEKVMELIERFSQEEFDLSSAPVNLMRDSVYIVELTAGVNISDINLGIRVNSKSSLGRIDLQTRLITDGNPHYDSIHGRAPYKSPLFLEIIPNSFHCRLSARTTLNQLRPSYGNPIMSDDEIRSVLLSHDILFQKDGSAIGRDMIQLHQGIVLSVDLTGEHSGSDVVGYVAKKHIGLVVDLQRKEQRSWRDFFDPIPAPKDGTLKLESGKFYLLSTNEAVSIPPMFAAELGQFDPRIGHLTLHYAGFFDAGFGFGNDGKLGGNTGTLEVRVNNRDEIIRHGQPICVLRMERMSRMPELAYGAEGRASNYERQIGVRVAKYFSD